MAMSTASEATVRENFDSIQSLLNQTRTRKAAKIRMAANLISAKSSGKIQELVINLATNHHLPTMGLHDYWIGEVRLKLT